MIKALINISKIVQVNYKLNSCKLDSDLMFANNWDSSCLEIS